MLVYNIRKAQYAEQLTASGFANRWNKNNEYVIYAGSSISLSTLELVVHRAAIQVENDYKLLTIALNMDEYDVQTIDVRNLPKNWRSILAYPILQKIGSTWYQKKEKLLLKVPSAVVPQEFNFLINTQHPDFVSKVRIDSLQNFLWDDRLCYP